MCAPTAASLRGKVVLIDVFTFGCYDASGYVQIIGVHTPETAYERNRANLVENLKAQGIVWPVAVDNDMAIWHAYDSQYWPTQMLFDRIVASLVAEKERSTPFAVYETGRRVPWATRFRARRV